MCILLSEIFLFHIHMCFIGGACCYCFGFFLRNAIDSYYYY